MLLLHYSSVARINRMWDLKKTWHLFENGSARMRELLVPGFLDNLKSHRKIGNRKSNFTDLDQKILQIRFSTRNEDFSTRDEDFSNAP